MPQACVQAIYGVPTAQATSSATNILGVTGYVNVRYHAFTCQIYSSDHGFIQQFANQADLTVCTSTLVFNQLN